VRAPALVLLEGDLDAQRLVATWHLVGEGIDSVEGALQTADRWAPLAGVAEPEIDRAVPMLWASGILLPDGEADQAALGWITARTRQLAEDARRRR
jgi:hypothetical protein